MYGVLLERLAADAERGGPVAQILRGHEGDPGPSALALRFLGSVHRLVLTGRAPDLGPYYPSVGGTWDDDAGPAAVIAFVAEHPDLAAQWLDRAPQTNEVGRATALYGSLLQLPHTHRLPVRLYEIGASGGLNLLADRYRYLDDAGRGYGPQSSPVQLQPAWSGATLTPWPDLEFISTRGCDLHPVDVSSPHGRTQVMAYVWPDQTQRLDRLRGALELAADAPPDVVARGAGDFVDDVTLADGTLTVLWHSVMWQYLPEHERQRIAARLTELGGRATPDAPLAHVRFEPSRRTPDARHEFLVRLTTWPNRSETILGTAAPHGVPARWERGDNQRA